MACAGHGEPEPEAESVPEPEPCVRIQLHCLRRARTMHRRCDMVLLLCHMIMPISMVNIDIVCFSRSAGRKFSRKEFHTHTVESGGAWERKKTHTSQSYICWFVPKDLPTSRAPYCLAGVGYSRNFHMEIFANDIGTKMIVKSNDFITGRHFPTVPQPSPCVCKDFPCYWFFFFSFSLLTVVCWEIAEGQRDKMLANTWQRENLWQSSSSAASPA